MSENETPRFGLTLEDTSKYPWQEVVSNEPKKECFNFCSAFFKAAKDAKDREDELGVRIYEFFGTINHCSMRAEKDTNPYVPKLTYTDGSRSFQPDDLDKQDLDLLEQIVNDIDDPEFRARVADVLWVQRKDFKAAQVAVEAFVQSALRLKNPESWPSYVLRLERAAHIAAKRGFEKQRERVLEVTEQIIEGYKDDISTGLACLKLMEVLLKLDADDCITYAQLAEDLARQFAKANDWRFSQKYWRVAKSWQHRLKDEAAMQRCALEAAECDVSNAEGIMEQGGQAMNAAHWMSRGLEALRQAKATPERIQTVHAALLKMQEKSTEELGVVQTTEDDIEGMKEERERIQQACIKLVSGCSFEEALEKLALKFRPTNFEALKKRDEEMAEHSILSRIIGVSMMDASGKVTARIPGSSPGSSEEAEVTRKRLVQSARQVDWNLAVSWRIEPARLQIQQEHAIRTSDLWYLVRDNPFIKPGHEGIYLDGIQAGFFGDWLVAMHLLVPQMESSLRFVLNQQDVITSKIKSDGIQQDFDLNELLWMEEVEAIFGPNILFDLRGILIERVGCNLRNELAHGLMPKGAFYTAEAPYFWWLVLHLLYIGHMQIKR